MLIPKTSDTTINTLTSFPNKSVAEVKHRFNRWRVSRNGFRPYTSISTSETL